MDSTVSMTSLADRLCLEVSAQILQAAKEVDRHGLSAQATECALLKAVQRRLSSTHGSPLVVHVSRKRQRERDAGISKKLRIWKPKRPALALEVAQLIKDSVGLTEAPVDRRDCMLPLKYFAKPIVSKLISSTESNGFSPSSIGYAVSEVISAVCIEAESKRKTNCSK